MSRLLKVAGVLRHVRGWIPDTRDHRDLLMAADPAVTLPTAASLRPVCPPIRDQGQLGTCTANSSLEGMGFLYTKTGTVDPLLSRLFCYYYSRKIEGTPPTEDSGCQIRDVMSALATYGAPPESVWPYIEDQFSTEPSHDAFIAAQVHKLLFYYRCPNLFTMKSSIAQGYPVVMGFSVPENMMSDACASTGIVNYPGPTEGFDGGHAVLAVGYDDVTQRVCFQNSWGTSWGDGGFGYLPYAMFDNNFVTDCWTLRREQM